MEVKPKTMADVSIIAANYNNGKYLGAFIESVVINSMWPKELIIVDDGSTDDSMKILDTYEDLSFLKVVIFKQNKGLTDALNAGLDVATGTYIMRADPDDLLLPDRIKTQYDYMQKHQQVDVLGSNVIYFSDRDGSDINVSNFPLHHQAIAERYRMGEHGLQHPTAFVKGHVYKSYRYQKIFPAEDYELFSRMVKDGCIFANIPDPLYKMRVHTASSTSNLRYAAIKQTFDFRDQIFGTKTSKVRIWLYYHHIWHYRLSQLVANPLKRYFHLAVSALCYPQKLLKRL